MATTSFLDQVAAATRAFTGWRGSQAPLYDNDNWDDWTVRLKRYALYEYYYNNIQYDNLNQMGREIKRAGNLYVNTRSIFNPVHRLANIYSDKVYPSAIDFITLNGGAIPVVASVEIRKALIQLFRWSNFNSEKQAYIRTAEKYGDVFLKIVDDIGGKRVIIETLAPHKVRHMVKDAAGNIDEIWLQYVRVDEERTVSLKEKDRQTKVEITEIITSETIQIYEDETLVSEYTNPFGFVPIVHAKALDEGHLFGAPRFVASRVKIDEINSQAALLNDQTRKSVIPFIATIGGQLDAKAMRRSPETMDETINISMPQGGDVKAVVPRVDITGALQNIERQLSELREDNPELFLYQLTNMSVAPSGVALRQFMDLAVNKITGAMSIYDDTLIRACQMAMTIGGYHNYKSFEPFDLQSFAKGDLDFYIRPREVIYNQMSTEKRLEFLMASGAPQFAVWNELEISLEDQQLWLEWIKEQDTVAIQSQIDQFHSLGGAVNPTPLNLDKGIGLPEADSDVNLT